MHSLLVSSTIIFCFILYCGMLFKKTKTKPNRFLCSLVTDVDKLLGDPIQKKIESESGLKTTLESILSICAGLYNRQNFISFGIFASRGINWH